ncbi:MAG: tetratricopeptide repeat protein [Anaerolineae bacterium]|nr:tetratricopeptide repeat protein [Anaerolineae bacterium]
MAGDREVYNKAMNTGHSAAWDQQWDRAIAAYGRAVQEFPEDPDAHRSLGMALLQAHRLEEALKVYTRAHQLAPDDPIPLEKSADVLERMGRLREAAQQYIKVADIYISQRDLDKAIGTWERATHLTTGLIQIHAKLATAYERVGSTKKAIREYLTLAFNFQRLGDNEKAIQAVQRALRLDRSNSQALNTLRALESGSLMNAPVEEEAPAPEKRPTSAFEFSEETSQERKIGEADPRGPLGEAEEFALTDLATFVFDSGDLSGGSTHAIQAIELQRQRQVQEAIAAYQSAIRERFAHIAIQLNLGVLYLETDPKTAIKHLTTATDDTRLAAGAHHGLAQAYMAINQPQEAAIHLVETLRMVDLELAVTESERSQLRAVYNNLLANIQRGDKQQLAAMSQRFFSLLTGGDWKQRVAETRRQLEETARTEGVTGMVEQLAEGGEELTESVSRIDRYLREGYLTLAMDEAYYATEIAPTYLPIHMRMAQVLMADNQMQPAISKYRMIANTYLAREQTERAAGILNEVLQIAPMDLEVRAKIIQILEKEEKWDEALNQYIDMADAYYQLADFDRARDTYQQAHQLAERLEASQKQNIHILHRMADIDVTRLDLRQALRTYEQIKAMDPNDERARRALMDLYFRLNNRVEAVKELDSLMRLYAQRQRADLISQVLEEQVALYPEEMALRSRLAAFYRRLGRIADAVAQLDALGELQLDAGMHSAAADTIRQIIAMNPSGVEDYKRLLSTLGG